MDISEDKGGWILVIIGFIVAVLKTIGLIRQKEEENEHEKERKRIKEWIKEEEAKLLGEGAGAKQTKEESNS
jgi:hypothetical protein